MKLGFIGTGNLAGFFVEGLSKAKAPYEITVSARNAEKARDLHQNLRNRWIPRAEMILRSYRLKPNFINFVFIVL